jgi:hypothetical protein
MGTVGPKEKGADGMMTVKGRHAPATQRSITKKIAWISREQLETRSRVRM